MQTARHLVLVGSMGAGKTTVGDRVARALGRELVDSDRVLAGAGEVAADIARKGGVAGLHERECRQLRQALAGSQQAVVAAAASTIEDPTCRAALADHDVVWLRIDPAEVVARMAAARSQGSGERGDHRRDLGPDPLGALRALAVRRDALYRDAASLVVDTGVLSPEDAAERILAALGAGPGRLVPEHPVAPPARDGQLRGSPGDPGSPGGR